ncbi:MAG: glycosyltransferase family 2 protein [Paludibacteraceae bacterium]|nr:glycosyltransferase family 2 protein [Paludibacteraceae bacterium]
MISVIICTYNRDKYLGETLQRLAANQYKGAWEIVLVNNNSTDTTEDICNRFAKEYPTLPFRYFVETNQGLSYARNRGMQEAKGDWFVFLDDDAFVENDYLSRLDQYIVQYPEMKAFGGKIYPLFEDGKEPEWLCKWNRSWLSAIDKGDEVCLFKGAEYPIGANMGFSRAIADKCGSFNTTLGRTGKNLIGGEEKDYFNRIKAQNAPIYYLPDIAVHHCIPNSRTTNDYIVRLGKGVGLSEKARTQSKGTLSYCKRIAGECVKWGATLLLWFVYTMRGQKAKGDSLVLFRKNVTQGLLSRA